MPRWNAWQCRLGRPGSAMPAMRSAPVARALRRDRRRSCRPSTSTRTSRAQPSGSSACSKNSSRRKSSAPFGLHRRPCSSTIGTVGAVCMRIGAALAITENAPCGSTRSGSTRGLRRWRLAGPASASIERGAVAAKDGRIAFAGPAAELPAGWDAARARDARRPLDHARADRLPHAPRLCGRPRARVRAAARGRQLRGDRARRRRHRLDREGDARGERGRARRAAPAAARRADRRRRHHDRDQVRLRARSRERSAACCAPRAGSARERDVDVVTTFLGAHALPPEANGDKDALHRRASAR